MLYLYVDTRIVPKLRTRGAVVYPLQYLSKKPLLPTKPVSLIKVKSCSALLRMLLVCILSYIKSVLRHKFLILDTYHPGPLYTRAKNVWKRSCVLFRTVVVGHDDSGGSIGASGESHCSLFSFAHSLSN